MLIFCSPPKFDFEAALERKRLKEKNKILKQKKHLEAFVKPSLHVTVTENVEMETTTESVEEFQDAIYHKRIIDEYLEDYEDVSEDMTDEDYL